MLTHEQIWAAIDDLAGRNSLSPSGLARRSGLDPTSFNKSKRQTAAGRARWPSTESIAKALSATNTSINDFMAILSPDRNGQEDFGHKSHLGDELGNRPRQGQANRIGSAQMHGQPVVSPGGFAEAATLHSLSGKYHSQNSASALTAAVEIPLIGFAQAGIGGFFDNSGFPIGEGWDRVELPTDSEEGTYALQVSGESMLPLYRDGDVIIVSPAAQVRKGDRVVVRTLAGEVMAKLLSRSTSSGVELHSLNPEHPGRVLQKQEIDWIARIIWASQ